MRDCVLVRSGTKKSDKPYIAKIASLWKESGKLGSVAILYTIFNTSE